MDRDTEFLGRLVDTAAANHRDSHARLGRSESVELPQGVRIGKRLRFGIRQKYYDSGLGIWTDAGRLRERSQKNFEGSPQRWPENRKPAPRHDARAGCSPAHPGEQFFQPGGYLPVRRYKLAARPLQAVAK